MKRAIAIVGLILARTVVSSFAGEEDPTPYERLMSIYESGVTDEKFYAFVTSLSREEFRLLLIEYRQNNVPSPQVNVFGGMCMLKRPYYEKGAGQQEGFEEWIHDVSDHSLPSEWRSILIQYPICDVGSFTTDQRTRYRDLLYSIVVSADQEPGLRRQALMVLPSVIQYDAISAEKLNRYAESLKRIITTPDQHTGLFQIALREIGHVINSAKQVATKVHNPTVAKAIQTGDTKAVATDKALSEEQKQFFGQVAQLSVDYDVILHDVGSSTNLPNYLLREVQRTQAQREADAENQ